MAGHEEILKVIDMLITMIVVMGSWVYAFVQTYQIVYIKYVQFFIYQLYINKAVKNIKWKMVIVAKQKQTKKDPLSSVLS